MSELRFSKGSVELVDKMGDDKTVVNAARISFDKWVDEMRPRDTRLIKYLWEHKHTSPFRHATMQFRIHAPIFVMRQWMKHVVGCAWNEMSRRYVQEDVTFWDFEGTWRGRPDGSIKQGSGGLLTGYPQSTSDFKYRRGCFEALNDYSYLLDNGVAPEQARACLPQSTMTRCLWTASVHAVLNFLDQRLDSHAQPEIQIFAQKVEKELASSFPCVYSMWVKDRAPSSPSPSPDQD